MRTVALIKEARLSAWASLLAACASALTACGPGTLTPVSQPITCDCAWSTEVFAGSFDSGSTPGGQATTIQVVVESGGNARRLSFLVPSKAVVCTLVASTGTTFDPGQQCANPTAPDAKMIVDGGSWSRSADGARLQVSYDWRSAPQGPTSRATFEGAATRMPYTPPDAPPICTRSLSGPPRAPLAAN